MKGNYGISRIDQPDKKNHGFYVRITHAGKLNQKFFPDKASGGKNKALAKAKEYRDDVVAKLPKAKQESISQRRTKIKQSGVTGVTHVVAKAPDGKKAYEYWQAAWEDASGARQTAKFSTSRYGEKEALEMAKKALGKTTVKKAAGKKATVKKAAKKATVKKAAKKAIVKKPAKKGKKNRVR